MRSGGQPGPHKIQGLGAGFVPDTLDKDIYDEVIQVSNEDAFRVGREIGRAEGVVLLPDSGDRYLSSPLFQD